jgi:hypothetical protein
VFTGGARSLSAEETCYLSTLRELCSLMSILHYRFRRVSSAIPSHCFFLFQDLGLHVEHS